MPRPNDDSAKLPAKPKPMPKYQEEEDDFLENIDKGAVRPGNLRQARQAFPGTKIKRPRFGGMSVGR